MVFSGSSQRSIKGKFYFLEKDESGTISVVSFYFWQAVQGNLFDGTQMTPNDLPYLDPLQSAYSLLIIGLVLFGNARNSQKIRLYQWLNG